MKVSERNMFGIKLFTQPVEPNTITTFVRQYTDLQELKSNMLNNSDYFGKALGFELFALLSYPEISKNGYPYANKEFVDWFYDKFMLNDEGEVLPVKERTNILDLMNENTNYLFTPECLETASEIRLKNFTLRFLKKVKTQKATYLLDKDRFFRFYKTDTEIVGGLFSKDKDWETNTSYKGLDKLLADNPNDKLLNEMSIQKEFGFDYNLFRIDLLNKTIEINDKKYLDEHSKSFLEDSQQKVYKLFIQLLLFVCLSEPEIKIVPPNTKIGKTKKDKVINSTRSEVVVVTDKWNQISVRAEGFKVRGHFRLQPCGKDRQDVKLIYVDTFQKNGYIRRANKDKFN